MPIHEYQCQECHKVSEFLIGVGQGTAEIKCRYCGSKNMKRQFSNMFITMGDGSRPRPDGKTCCGRDERCDQPPCGNKGECPR